MFNGIAVDPRIQ